MTPSLSIITPVRNGAATIRECVASVKKQTLPVEHIIVDGASTDGTVELARRLSPEARIVSEPDRGIYDAMNKGILRSSGEIVGILNSDDFYPSPDLLAKVAAAFEDPRVDACYGDLLCVQEIPEPPSPAHPDRFRGVRYWRSGSFTEQSFYWGWMPPHPAFFLRRRCYQEFGLYRNDLGTAADYELMLRMLLKHRVAAAYLPETLVWMRSGGASNARLASRLKANLMDRKAWQVNGLTPYPWTLSLKPLRKLPQWLLGPAKEEAAYGAPSFAAVWGKGRVTASGH